MASELHAWAVDFGAGAGAPPDTARLLASIYELGVQHRLEKLKRAQSGNSEPFKKSNCL